MMGCTSIRRSCSAPPTMRRPRRVPVRRYRAEPENARQAQTDDRDRRSRDIQQLHVRPYRAEPLLAVRGDVIVLCHGGPISMPEDAAYVLSRTKTCHGFYGASSMERLPTERAIAEQVGSFVNLNVA